MCKIFSQNVTSQPFIEKAKTAKNKQRKIDTDGIGFIHFTRRRTKVRRVVKPIRYVQFLPFK